MSPGHFWPNTHVQTHTCKHTELWGGLPLNPWLGNCICLECVCKACVCFNFYVYIRTLKPYLLERSTEQDPGCPPLSSAAFSVRPLATLVMTLVWKHLKVEILSVWSPWETRERETGRVKFAAPRCGFALNPFDIFARCAPSEWLILRLWPPQKAMLPVTLPETSSWLIFHFSHLFQACTRAAVFVRPALIQDNIGIISFFYLNFCLPVINANLDIYVKSNLANVCIFILVFSLEWINHTLVGCGYSLNCVLCSSAGLVWKFNKPLVQCEEMRFLL